MEIEENGKQMEHEESATPIKKPRLWSAKDFRKQLKTTQKVTAIQHFLEKCSEDDSCVIEYLESGGNCMELIQLLAINEIPAVNILEILNCVLLQIVTNETNLEPAAYDSCKLFVQSHLSSINKMLALGSPRKHKKIILKLLTTLVTFSKNLAKEILLHVNLNPSNVEILAKQGDGKDSVRNAYIQFLMSFLVEGEAATISIFLDKRILLTSIFKGLQNDSADTVLLVITTLKKYVLENPGVTKTTKMSLFSTPVIRGIVTLYNWKGTKTADSPIDPMKKAMVSECVHSFLLVLCTSFKYGVIFKDPYIGLRPKPSNNLMYTILESLERPWEHSYAGELVRKICGACPDLVKSVWGNLRNFLEPRHTDKWLIAIRYAVALIKELQPNSIELSTEVLTGQQICQIIPNLVAPSAILQTILPKNFALEKPIVKYNIIVLLVECLKSIKNYLSTMERSLKQQQFYILKMSIKDYILKHFVSVDHAIIKWTQLDDDEPYSVEENVEAILELLDLYESNCPPLLEGLTNTNLKSLLEEIDSLSNGTHMKVRLVNLFLNYEPSIFSPSSDMFATVFPLILKHYIETDSEKAYRTLNVLLNNSSVFEGAVEEIEVWINTVLYFTDIDEISGMLVDVIRNTTENIITYIAEMHEFDTFEYVEEKEQLHEVLDGLEYDSYQSSELIRSTRLSPMLIGALNYIRQNRHVKHYLNAVLVNLLHLQTSSHLISAIVLHERYDDLISKSIKHYISGWSKGEASVLVKTKLSLSQSFSAQFLTGEISELENQRPWELRHCLNQALFYFTHLNCDLINETHVQNCLAVIKRTNEFGVIFKHPTLLKRFLPSTQNVTNKLIIEVIRLDSNNSLLKPFRTKLLHALCKILKKRKKWHDIMEIVECIGLEHAQCVDFLNACVNVEVNTKDDFLGFLYKVLVYTFEKFLQDCSILRPLNDNVITKMSELLSWLNLNGFDTSHCTSIFHSYLRTFPHSLSETNVSLFESIILKNDLHKEDIKFAGFLLSNRSDFLDTFKDHFESILKRKGLVLTLLKSTVSLQADDDVLQEMYTYFEPTIIKVLEKSKKSSQHFEEHKDTVVTLIGRFMSLKNCKKYMEKVIKFESIQPYHIHILIAIFGKILDGEISEAESHNILLTIAIATNSLFKRKDKSEDDWNALEEVARVSQNLYKKLGALKVSFRRVCEDRAFNLYCSFCLKFGLLGRVIFIELMSVLLQFLDFNVNEAQTLLEMTGSHSEFLEIILGEDSECKTQLLKLILEFCKRWQSLMYKAHVPVLLSAYQGTVSAADQINLTLIQMYETEAQQTSFYDFKPFLWGKAAATHYSVRQDIQWTLWRQPRMHNILEILEVSKINNTICYHPLDVTLNDSTNTNLLHENVYSLSFFLPLFASLLAPENQVTIHMFIKSGALSMTIVGLSCYNKDIRLASCHVLARFHYHLEARRGGKDRLLRLSFVEALCRGTAVLEDFKLNNFASIFWAKMALILTRPLHPMYLPLSRYLTSKPTPDLSGIPELYTFLHIPDVNFKDPKFFILKILRDGMRTDHDCSVASYKMAFKLIMELFSSCVSDLETKLAVLKVFESSSKLKLGQEILTTSYGLLSWLYDVINDHNKHVEILSVVLHILANLTTKLPDSKYVDCNILKLILVTIIDYRLETMTRENLNNLLLVILRVLDVSQNFITVEQLQYLIGLSNDDKCTYLLKYGCNFCTLNDEELMQTLVRKWMNK